MSERASALASIKSLPATQLRVGMAIVEYFFGDSSIYRFDLTAEGLHFTAIGKTEEVKAIIRNFHGHIINYPLRMAGGNEVSTAEYAADAYTLYQKLFTGFRDSAYTELVIIPDGLLWYVPFDALIYSDSEQKDNFRTLDYMLHKYSISYNYAANMRAVTVNRKNKYRYSLLAVAPLFHGTQGLIADRSTNFARLDYNETEALAIKRQIGGTAITGMEATRTAFLERAGDFQLLHLATHAEANNESGEYSYLAFAGDSLAEAVSILYVKDIYNLSLSANMVVLSACETGVGQISSGEGFISLGRAFSYAGASSILTTLWKINDATTAELMHQFYRNLKSGKKKQIALQQAKQQYINDSRITAAHPYYWAAFIPLGDMQPLQISRQPNWLTWLLTSLAVIALLFLAYRYLPGFRRKPKELKIHDAQK